MAREILAQLPDVDTVVTPVGGGGLAAGLGVEMVPRGIQRIGRLTRSQLRHEALAGRRSCLYPVRRRPHPGRGPGRRGQRAHLRHGQGLLPRDRPGERGGHARGHRVRLPVAGHRVRGLGRGRAGWPAGRQAPGARPARGGPGKRRQHRE